MAEFDEVAQCYEELLKDPVRDLFSTGGQDFFYLRKWILLREFCERHGISPRHMDWIDVGCGTGQFLRLGASEMRSVRGCDVSREMLRACEGLDVSVQEDDLALPFSNASADLMTAVCVYHHVRPSDRAQLTLETARVLRPGGIFCIIEHNPWNPATRLIVSRTPVDANAVLLRMKESMSLLRNAGLDIVHREFFLYLPEKIYERAPQFEGLLRRVPLGGQYAVFARKR